MSQTNVDHETELTGKTPAIDSPASDGLDNGGFGDPIVLLGDALKTHSTAAANVKNNDGMVDLIVGNVGTPQRGFLADTKIRHPWDILGYRFKTV